MEEIIAERVKEAVEAQIVPLCAALDRIIANLGALNRRADEMNAELQRGYEEGMDLDASLRLAVRALRQAAQPGETGSRLEVAVLERDRARRSFRRLSEEDVASRTAEPGP